MEVASQIGGGTVYIMEAHILQFQETVKECFKTLQHVILSQKMPKIYISCKMALYKGWTAL